MTWYIMAAIKHVRSAWCGAQRPSPQTYKLFPHNYRINWLQNFNLHYVTGSRQGTDHLAFDERAEGGLQGHCSSRPDTQENKQSLAACSACTSVSSVHSTSLSCCRGLILSPGIDTPHHLDHGHGWTSEISMFRLLRIISMNHGGDTLRTYLGTGLQTK